MLQYALRYNIGVSKGGAFRDWLLANDAALHEHQPRGWRPTSAPGLQSSASGTSAAESRFEVDGYEALGSGFGDDVAQRLARELFEDFID